MDLIKAFSQNPVAGMVLIIALGTLIGRVRAVGFQLGSSAVLFVALACGHFGCVSGAGLKPLGDFGVVLFVYAIGLQAGPRFVRTIRGKGSTPILVGLATVVGGAAFAAVVGKLIGLQPEMVVGVFAGALTSTPALAAATEASDSPLVSVAYGVAYPFGVVGVVLFSQLVPRWLGRDGNGNRRPDVPASDPVHQRCFLVQNPGCIGKRLSALRLREMASVNISRILRGDEVLPSGGDIQLERDDIVLAVGTNQELDHLALLVGPPVPAEIEMSHVPDVLARDIYISESAFSGKTLRELHVRSAYGIVITRVRREGVEFVPRGDFMLEIGDLVRAVGYEPDVKSFATAAGIHEQRIHETGIPAFATGLLLGLLLGYMPVHLFGDMTFRLGLAGGPLFVGILLGHFGRIGKLRVHVPSAARYLMRELGLVLFLASAGTCAGAKIMPMLASHGVALFAAAALAVGASLVIGFVVAYVLCRQSVPSALGMTCGAMTSTPGLGAASAQFESDVPALSYATVYPLALVLMTVVAQLMVTFLT